MAAIALNQPYKPNLTIPKEKIDTLFSLMNQMDTQQIKQFSIVNNIPLNVNDTNGENLIHKAINIENMLKKEFHRLNIIKFLIQNDVNPDKPNKENQTPLHLACKMQYADIVKYLIEIGVNVNYQDNYGSTPFHYALQGQIKLFEPYKEIKDFIQPQKKVDTKKKEQLLEIKKEIWDIIKNCKFIKSIEQTIDSTIFDDEIKKYSLELYKKISTKITQTEEINYFKSIKEEFDIFKNKIKIIVGEKWLNFPEISDIVIHKKEKNSYDLSGNDLSFLKNINVKEWIKSKIKKNKNNIKEFCKKTYSNNQKKPYNIDFENEKLTNQIYVDFFYKHKDKHFDFNQGEWEIYSFYDFILPDWENFNRLEILDENAVDNADNIIDWDKLTFMGGSRNIEIIVDFEKIKKILKYDNTKTKVTYILYNYNNNVNYFNQSPLNNEIDPLPLFNQFDYLRKLVIDMATYKIMDEPLHPIRIELETLNNIPVPPPLSQQEIEDLIFFYDRWEELLSHKNKGSTIYTMFSNLVCQENNSGNDDNLTGEMSCMISIIASALNIEDQTIDDAITTCIKKYCIEYTMTDLTNPRFKPNNIDFTNALKILLADTLDFNDNGQIVVNEDKDKVKQIVELINDIVFENNLIEKRNIFFKVITLITEKIKEMENKPLIQDTIFLITFINNYCLKNDNTCTKKFLSISELNINNINQILNDNIYSELLSLIKNNNNLHLIPYFYVKMDLARDKDIYDDDTSNGLTNLTDYIMNKFKESKHLGLYYRGLIPHQKTSDELLLIPGYIGGQGYKNKNIPVNNTQNLFFLINNGDYNWPILNLIGNYNDDIFNLAPQNIYKKFKEYKYVYYKYRPPIKGIVKIANNYVQNFIINELSMILYESQYEQNLYTIIDSNKQLSKAFMDIYVYLSFFYDFLDDNVIKNDINSIIFNINEYNANLLLYNYLFKFYRNPNDEPNNMYKIPKFNYYLLPTLDKKKGSSFIYFDKEDTLIDLNSEVKVFRNRRVNDDTDRTKIIKEPSFNSQGNIRNANTYLGVMENIENNIISSSYSNINDNFKDYISGKLPPAIINKLKDFYNYNIILLLVDIFRNHNYDDTINEILKKLKKINNTDIFINNDDNIIDYYFMSKIVEELIREKMKYHIELQTNRILYKVIKKIDLPESFTDDFNNIILKPDEFILNMNKISKEITHYFYNEYQFSKVEKQKIAKFIIYPDEYANSDILKLKYELIIKKEIYNYLLDGNSNPYILDSNNQSPIFLLLKYHIPYVLENIKHLNYNNFSEIKPHDFLVLELKNHTHKLTNGTDKYKDWIENFVSYQKNEVITLILSNDKFGNNIPLYLEDSFNVITYITNQYLSESKNKDSKYLFINEIMNNLGIYNNIEKNIYIKIDENIKTRYNNLLNKEYESEQKQSILDENEILYHKINKRTNMILGDYRRSFFDRHVDPSIFVDSFIQKKNINKKDILARYKELDLLNLTILLSKFINTDLNQSKDLLTFQYITFEQKILNKPLNDNLTELTQLSEIKEFYDITNTKSNMYFTFNNYANNNEALKFSKDLLIFMTQNFICFPYYSLLLKILSSYFKTIYVSDSDEDIFYKVKYCLTNKILKEDNQSIKNILYRDVSKKLVLNAVQIFNNQEEEYLFSQESTKDIFDTVTNLLTINPSLSIPEDSPFFKTTIKEINSYFDTFVNKTILNWLVIIENVFKFNINQGRIIQSIYNLHF
jgi:hypothetical protein